MKNTKIKIKIIIAMYITYIAILPYIIYKSLYVINNIRTMSWMIFFMCAVGVPALLYIVYCIFNSFNVKKQDSAENDKKNIILSNSDDIKPGDSWPLVDFARMHGQMKVSTAYNAMFKKDCLDKCIFTANDGKETIAYIADVVKTYTPKMIEENKDKLHIRVLESGYYCLCENRIDVDLWNS